jgi:serine/threonine-protein kinase
MSTLIGQEFGGYRIISQIGKGGMATVYKAFQASLDRYVALKVMPPFYAEEDETFLKRFRREARSVAKLRHPNILMVIDYGEKDGLTYIVMEYVDAGTLTDRLGKPLPLTEIANIIEQIASALDYAHGQGVVHRDVKPSNILLPKPNWPLLTDFGLAKIVGGSQLTITGSIAGTPAYMSPEQGQGEPVDARSDIYSLGIVLYEMATGGVPYYAETPMAVVVKHIIDPLPLPSSKNPDLPESVERVILKALSKRPEDRYSRVNNLARALKMAVEKESPPTIKAPSREEEYEPEVTFEETETVMEPAPEKVLEGQAAEPAHEPEPFVAQEPAFPEREAKDSFMNTFSQTLAAKPWLKWVIPAGLIAGALCVLGVTVAGIVGLISEGNATATPRVVETLTADEHFELGATYLAADDLEAAAEQFRLAIDQGTQDLGAYFELAEIYRRLDRVDEGIQLVELAVEKGPEQSTVHEAAGTFFQLIEDHELAIEHFERALELDPSAEWLVDAMLISYEALGVSKSAEDILGDGKEKDPDLDPYEYESLGWQYLETNDLVRAEESFLKAVELDPTLIGAWEGLAEIYWSLDDLHAAVSILQEATVHNPEDSALFEELGWLYWELPDIDAAIFTFQRSIEVDREWSSAYTSLAELYREIGEEESAVAVLEQGIDANPERSDLYEYLGYFYLDLEKFEDSISVFEGAIEYDPSYGWNYYGLAIAYRGAGRWEEAEAELEEAGSNSFDDPWLYEAIGWEFMELGNCEKAIFYFEKAIDIDSSLDSAEEGINLCGG